MLFMRLITWQRDSHGLFDYESRSVDTFEFKTTAQGYLNRRTHELQGETSQVSATITYEKDQDNAMCCIIKEQNGNYCLTSTGEEES